MKHLHLLTVICLRLAVITGLRMMVAADPVLPKGLVDEPAVPAGLGNLDLPSLPAGLGGATANEPVLPAGLDSADAPPPLHSAPPHVLAIGNVIGKLSGFTETRAGLRLQNDPHERDASIGEFRLQLRLDHEADWIALTLVGDVLYDPVLNQHAIDLESGDGWLDLRQANVMLRPAPFADLKIGRQINTWGTGDLLFINDLFPKDWNSFFIGRDDDYLKAPSDSLKASFFSSLANLDVLYTPRFDSDRYIDGRRISYWNPSLGRRAGRDATLDADKPDSAGSDDEWAARLHRQVGAYEVAAYGYHGFWKSPAGTDPETGKARFPRLQVFGASARGPMGAGILSLETGWFRSRDDRDGDNPFVRNSEIRTLVGYEQELARNLTIGVQYYMEQMLDHGAYVDTLPAGMHETDEFRHVVTLRLTQLMRNQNLALSLFVFYSPSDGDAYFRPNINYKVDDHWIVDVGGNLFVGREQASFLGQFEKNNNAYIGLRYGF